MDRAVKYPASGSPSVDHVNPLAHGGAMLDPANLRLAHLGCNASRAARKRNGLPAKPPAAGLPPRSSPLTW